MTADSRPTSPAALADAPIVIVTGMSGAGRSTTANVLEDLGWLVVDNLPPQLLTHLAELRDEARAQHPEEHLQQVAVVVDVRSRGWFAQLEGAIGAARERGERPSLVFLDATDEALVRRFESVRRPHPLQGEGRLLDGIQRERELLLDLRSSADVVFDMRFLPNPYWVPELRALTGRDTPVSEFVMKQEGADEFLDRAGDLLDTMIDGYVREGRRYVTVAVGCTGGKHRSVAIAEALSGRLGGRDRVDTFVVHRDLGRE